MTTLTSQPPKSATQPENTRSELNSGGHHDARERGRAEVRLCRRGPLQRAASPLGDLTAGPAWRATLQTFAVRFPAFTEVLLALRGAVASVAKILGMPGPAIKAASARDSFRFFLGAIDEAGGWSAFRREFAERLPVLCYHHVGEKLPQSWPLLTVSPEVFRRQIEWLAEHGYTGIHAADWLAWIERGTALPEKPILITFDDGYSDLVDKAIPVLEEFGFKATIFIVSQHIGAASTWDAALGHPSRPLMTAEQVRECPSHGIEIGAHSRTHPDLRTLTDTALRTELEGCRSELTELMGFPVNTLAYCFGFQNEQVRKRAGETYDLSFSCKPGLNAWRTDPTCLRRMFVHPSRINFALQVKYGIDLHAVYRFAIDRLGRIVRKTVPATGHPQSLTGQAGAAQVTDVNR
jgi:peptidoglycan/xylan/chitin deacetylase (PgdA/CDA1 family)